MSVGWERTKGVILYTQPDPCSPDRFFPVDPPISRSLRKRLAKADDDKIDVGHVDIPITVRVRDGALRDGVGVLPLATAHL